jgi:outer membrane protein TolC
MHLRPRRIANIFALLFILSGALSATAQQHPPVNNPNSSSSLYRRRTDSLAVHHILLPDSTVENRLVAYALQAPRYDAMGHQINVTKNQLELARRAWFNLLTVSVNYNDQTFAHTQATNTTQAYVYPKYFFGLTVPIGLFFTMGPQIHAARESVMIAEDNRDELARTIKMDVLSKYRTYKNYEALILLQNTIVVDNQAALSQIEQKFRDGTASIDQFNTANRGFSDEKAKLLNLQLAQDLVRLDIERMIGTSLDAATR